MTEVSEHTKNEANFNLLHIPTFEEETVLDDTQCDLNRFITPGSALRLCQRIATNHCNTIGMNDDFYAGTHTAWIATKLGLSWKRIPKAGERLLVRTTLEEFKKAQVKRIIEFIDDSGTPIGIADTRWVVVDTATWKILRTPPAAYEQLNFQDAVDMELPLDIPRGLQGEYSTTRTAAYTMCDLNKHVNNTFYADISCDALPTEAFTNAAVQSIVVHFRREISYGTTFDVLRLQQDDGTWFVQGVQQEKPCFSALLRLQEI